MAKVKFKYHSIIDDLSNLEFRIFICYYVFKWPPKKIAYRLNLHAIEVRKIIECIEKLKEFEALKEKIFEAFCFDMGDML